MKKIMILAYIFWALLGVVLLAWVIPANTEDSGYGLSPALLPNILATLMLLTSLVLLWQTLRSGNDKPSSITARHLLRLAAFCAIMFGAFPLMHAIGFLPGAAVTLVLLQLMCGQTSIPWLLGISLGLSGIAYLAMTYVLKVPMP
ncbi:MAG: tripartite tricarboxylate transporter TctB family protein [Mailhella sp.]|nr:tripartite tricarboxylate transporter TctB family protein [Mailhella sp.]